MRCQISLCAVFVLCLGLISCNPGPSKYEVSGKVTFDGEPVETGEVVLESVDRNSGSFAGQIHNGAYRLSAQEGNYIVRINGIKAFPLPEGQKSLSGDNLDRRQILPARYNAESQEKLEVKRSMTHDFTLLSK